MAIYALSMADAYAVAAAFSLMAICSSLSLSFASLVSRITLLMWVSVFVAIIEYIYIYGKDNKGGEIIKIRDRIDYDLVFTW